MKLPERLYYPLPEAAEKLNCTVRDILHYGAIGAIKISAYVKAYDNENWFHLNMPSKKSEEIDDMGMLSGEWWNIDFINFNHANEYFTVDGYYARAVTGFFYIDSSSLTDAEFRDDGEISLVRVSTGPESYVDDCIDINFVYGNAVKTSVSKLCIRAKDIDDIKPSGHIPDYAKSIESESSKTIAKKERIIKGLLSLIPEMSGEDIDELPVKKIKELVESIAAVRGVEFPNTDLGTWSKYLERGRFKK